MPRLRSLIALAALCLALLPPARAQEGYSFGVVPQFEAMRLASVWMPILGELERQTGYRFRLAGSPAIPAFEEGFSNGDFDFAYMNPYHAVMAATAQGYVPIIRDGGRELFGVLAVAKDGPITQVADLDGQAVAFPAPNALGASLMMRADLTNRFGIAFEPVYASTHSSAYLNVILGRTAAAGGVMGTFNNQPDEIRNALSIIYETDRVAPHPVVVHPRLPDEVRDAVQAAFLAMGDTEDGRAMLAGIPIREVRIATADDYRPLLDMGLDRFVE